MHRRGGTRVAAGAMCAAVLALAGGLAWGRSVHLKVVSETADGHDAYGYEEFNGIVSADGDRIAFSSNDADLPHGDGTTFRTYVRLVSSGKTMLASTTSGGQPASDDVRNGGISANGRFVAFWGPGDGLPGANGFDQVWVRDLKTGKTRLASTAANGDSADGSCLYASLSADGRFVVFRANAPNFPGPAGDNYIYVHDMKRNRTTLVSKSNPGQPVTGSLYGQAISGDGSRVVFESRDAALPGGSTDLHLYMRDLARKRTKVVDAKANGTIGNGDADSPSISTSGRYVSFDSYGTNLPGVHEPFEQEFRRDMKTGKLKVVSVNNAGQPQDGYAYYGQVSSDGRFVTFQADDATNLQGPGSPGQVYVRDLKKRKTILLSQKNGVAGDDYSDVPAISADGSWAAFESNAQNLGGTEQPTEMFRAGTGKR